MTQPSDTAYRPSSQANAGAPEVTSGVQDTPSGEVQNPVSPQARKPAGFPATARAVEYAPASAGAGRAVECHVSRSVVAHAAAVVVLGVSPVEPTATIVPPDSATAV